LLKASCEVKWHDSDRQGGWRRPALLYFVAVRRLRSALMEWWQLAFSLCRRPACRAIEVVGVATPRVTGPIQRGWGGALAVWIEGSSGQY
jgi:hypothetical protein